MNFFNKKQMVKSSLTSSFLLTTLIGLSACQGTPNPNRQIIVAGVPTSVSNNHQHVNFNKNNQGIYDYRLANGLRVIIKEDKRAPLVVTQIWYNVGSNDEPIGKGGLSHFLEHMMFKDAQGLSSQEYTRLLGHLGGSTNAFTSYDYTAYYEVLPANQYPVALQIEANRMKNLIFKQNELDTEKEVVKEERRLRTENNPIAQAYEIFIQKALPNSPNGLPIIGSMADIEGLNLDDLQTWYQHYYAPNNATLVLVGDIDSNVAQVWINKYFTPLSPTTLPKRPQLHQTSHRGYQKFATHQTVKNPTLLMAFNVPSLTSTQAKEAYALLLLSDIADGGRSARFEKNLIRTQGVLDEVAISYNMLSKGDTLFTIMATPRAGVSLEQAETAIMAELNKILTEEINDLELARGQANLVSGLVFEKDSLSNQAIELGMLATLNLPLDTNTNLPKTLKKISQEDIHQTGKKFIHQDNLTTMYIYPMPENNQQP